MTGHPPSAFSSVRSESADEALEELDDIVEQHRIRHRAEDAQAAGVEHGRRAFMDCFDYLCATQVRPAMVAAVDRLRSDGADGVIAVHPGGEPRFRHPSIVLWMSLEGEVAEPYREDRCPYLRLEADIGRRCVQVWQGDMWEGSGTSGPLGDWDLSEITSTRVEQAIVEVLRRAEAT